MLRLWFVWTYDSLVHWLGFHSFYCRCRDNELVRCCICKGGVGVVAYKVPKPFGRVEQVVFCESCIESLRKTGGLM